MKDCKATLYLLRVTGIVNNRCIVRPLNQKYLSTEFVRKTNAKSIYHFVFFLSTQFSLTNALESTVPYYLNFPELAFLLGGGGLQGRIQEEEKVK